MNNKLQLISLFLLTSFLTFGQGEYDVDDPFEGVFQGMFEVGEPIFIPEDTPPVPPVPLDGGLIALIAAGSGMAYQKYRVKKDKERG